MRSTYATHPIFHHFSQDLRTNLFQEEANDRSRKAKRVTWSMVHAIQGQVGVYQSIEAIECPISSIKILIQVLICFKLKIELDTGTPNMREDFWFP